MAYTVISSIGTSMYKEGYRKTTYQFPNGKKEETSWFLQALLKAEYRDFNKVLLVGTTTSTWDALVDDNESPKLWEELYKVNCSKTGITKELAVQLEEQLAKQYGIPVKIYFHTDKIDYDTAESVFNTYHSLIPEIPKDSDVLFDITHGFRSMPILMYQNLQLLFSNDTQHKIEFVYGEYIQDEKISYVRDLSMFWRLSQMTEALSIFETKLDGFTLSELVADEWPKGSKAIKSLSSIVQTNFALQFAEVASQIRNALMTIPEYPSSWLLETKDLLDKFLKLENGNSYARTLYNYSQFLYAHKLNTQAVITLQTAVETALFEKYGDDNTELGSYDWIDSVGKQKLKELRGLYKDELEPLGNLVNFRNQIAHGGGKNLRGGYPRAENIPSIYASGQRGLKNLFRILEI